MAEQGQSGEDKLISALSLPHLQGQGTSPCPHTTLDIGSSAESGSLQVCSGAQSFTSSLLMPPLRVATVNNKNREQPVFWPSWFDLTVQHSSNRPRTWATQVQRGIFGRGGADPRAEPKVTGVLEKQKKREGETLVIQALLGGRLKVRGICLRTCCWVNQIPKPGSGQVLYSLPRGQGDRILSDSWNLGVCGSAWSMLLEKWFTPESFSEGKVWRGLWSTR